MRLRKRYLIAATLLTLLILAPGLALAQPGFKFGAYHDYILSGFNLDTFDSCGFNSIAVTLDNPLVGSRNLDSLAARNLEVMAGIPDSNHIQDAAANAELIHWQAENEGSIRTWVPPISQSAVSATVTHVKGGQHGDAWKVDAPETSGVAWQLTDYVQVTRTPYTALFYLRVDSLPVGNIARLRVFDVNDSSRSFDSVITAADFSDTTSYHPISLGYNYTDSITELWRSAVTIDWYGTCALSMDSLVIFNEDGKALVRDSGTDIRNNIIAQVQNYSAIMLSDSTGPALRWWYGPENLWAHNKTNWSLLGNLEIARYLDFIIDSLSPGAGFTWEGTRNASFWLEHDSLFFDLNPTHFRLFSYPFGVHSLPPDQDSVAALNELIDGLTETLRSYRDVTEARHLPLYYTAQAFATDHWYPGDIPYAEPSRPTAAEIKCFGFLGLCYGVDGLWYWPYDEGYNDSPYTSVIRFSGLIRNDGSPTFKYDAVKNAVGPFVTRFGDLIVSLDRQEVGLLDTLAGVSDIFVSSFESTEDTPYVEVGFFTGPGSADYMVLVNRRTDTASTQTLTLTIDPSDLESSGSTMYYLIDKNPTYAGSAEDTVLAGPINGLMQYTTTIEPGGAKFLKIVAGPDRIRFSNFPPTWWGVIHADSALWVDTGRTLTVLSGVDLIMHTNGWNASSATFTVRGSLLAAGAPGSEIAFEHACDGAGCDPEIVNCDDYDEDHWAGFYVDGAQACSLQYCEIRNTITAVYSNLPTSVVLDHVTTTNGGDPAVVQIASGSSIRMTHCNLDGGIQVSGGQLIVDYSSVDSAATGVSLTGASSGDTAYITNTSVVHCADVGIVSLGYPLFVSACSVAVSNVGVRARNAPVTLEAVEVQSCAIGIRIDSNAVATAYGVKVGASAIGWLFDGGWGSLDSCYVFSADTAMYADPDSGHSISLTDMNIFGQNSRKGIAARSGEVTIEDSYIYTMSTGLTGIDAFSGDAVVRMTGTEVQSSPTSAAGVSVGPEARIVATQCNVHDSYIGFELKGDGADTITGCRILSNSYYGLWFAGGDAEDYSQGNYIQGVQTAQWNSGAGIRVSSQSLESSNDTVWGYYDALVNCYGSFSATFTDLVAIGKTYDSYGIFVTGSYGGYDSVMISGAVVDSDFYVAQAYLNTAYVDISESEFYSTGDPATSALYGIYDAGQTSGSISCTKAIDQTYGCVGRQWSSSIVYGDASLSGSGKNSFYVRDSADYSGCKYFRNFGTDTFKVENNYWGQSHPPASRFAGPVDTVPYKTSSPICSQYEAKVAGEADAPELPEGFALEQNYPNPFNPTTTIRFALPIEQRVRLDLFNVLGQRVRSFDLGSTPAGNQSVVWNGSDERGRPAGSGIYFYRLWTPQFTETKKMLLLK